MDSAGTNVNRNRGGGDIRFQRKERRAKKTSSTEGANRGSGRAAGKEGDSRGNKRLTDRQKMKFKHMSSSLQLLTSVIQVGEQ